MNKRLFILVLLFILGLSTIAVASHLEMPAGKHFTLIDENNNILHQTGMQVFVGDEYIAADNSRYKVIEIQGDTAHCVYQGKEQMPFIDYSETNNAAILNDKEVPVISEKDKPKIAIYHTHNDESYVPSDGSESINGNGGIHDVGKALAEKLKKLGFNVDYSDNNHNPHDINAYSRSRRTAASLLKKQPDAIIDVHRDATPPEVYQTQVKGEDATKIKLVVGRQNPNMKTNLEFAKKIKAAMDKKEPGLSNGIFIGKGDYNQDLSPRSILIEVGSHTNKKEDAQDGVELFAETIPVVLGVSDNAQNSGEAAKKPLTSDNQGAGTTILVILVILAAAAGGYYLLNRGSTSK